ncbi:phasin family protein [Pukyongiella litopenaei]|uniref:Phasin family protein n=1 Tax=Pukyongiella litopenaei TaxID=2605946 RepID=A0A2S0MPL4_9RHOB|nr:phasin family protein [Pukyongiella litopenaei]AVO37808.1 phasin family protein [Pukyongiella litopenaei]
MTKATASKAPAASDALKEQTAAVQNFFGNLFEAGKLSVANTIEFDKLLLTRLGEGANEAFQHGKSVLAAKDIKTVVELQSAYVQDRMEHGVATTKELMEFAQAKAREVVEPFKKSA